MGEHQAATLKAKPYSEKAFKEVLPEIKSIMANHPPDFFYQLQSLCANAGVKVVHTPCLPKAPVNGSTRWFKDTPLIQLTGRYKRNDIFWFTFFHEVAHILKHGKKDIFLEDIEYGDKDVKKEKEADAFAAEWILSVTEEREVVQAAPLNEEIVHYFAKKFNTHSAIIIGRLQHRGLIHPSEGRQFFEKIEFE